jgi:hypothetical protein
MWVLNEKSISSSDSLLEVYTINVPGKKKESLNVSQIMEKLKIGKLNMNDLQPDVGDKIRKAAVQLKRLNEKQV